MKLIKVFSESHFKNVCFNEDYNIILATIHDTNHKKDTHNLGKTSLLTVIDFLLLSTFTKQSGLLTNPIFDGQTFYLEIKLNSGQYLVIRRSLKEPSKVSFKLNNKKLSDFIPPTEWDEENLAFEKAKEKLNEYLGFDVLTEWSYRKSISYFLRTQKDYLDVFQLNKFKGKHSDWKPFMFDLLRFDGSLIKNKLDIDKQIGDKENEIKTLQQQANVNVAERDKIAGLIDIKNLEKEKAEEEIDRFNFYTKDSNITKELIDSIDMKLQALNSDRYRIGTEIKKINNSLNQSKSVVHVDKLKELYSEVSILFPETLYKKFEDLENFTNSISTERKTYLTENLKNLNAEYEEVDRNIKGEEEERSIVISWLTEKDVYDKFKTYQKQLAKLESELGSLQEKLRLIDTSFSIKESIATLKEQRKSYVAQIHTAIDKRAHAEINRIFNQIITEVVGTNAIISIKQNKEGNVEFNADYQTSSQIMTSEADGTSYKKLLCVAFDIALLIYYSSRSFYKFAYHDGVMEGLDDRIKVRLLTATQRICSEYGLQYILTLIDSDIPEPTGNVTYQFPKEAVCLHLNDKDDSGKLFGRSF